MWVYWLSKFLSWFIHSTCGFVQKKKLQSVIIDLIILRLVIPNYRLEPTTKFVGIAYIIKVRQHVIQTSRSEDSLTVKPPYANIYVFIDYENNKFLKK